MRFLALPQNSPEWATWRRSGIGASEAPAILGVSPWQTPLGLWKLKTGQTTEPEQNFAMRRGLRLEPVARQAYEARCGRAMAPVCVQHDEYDWLRASLDGLDDWGELVLEIKAPSLHAHQLALGGAVPPYYVPQLQHQLLVTGCPRLHYWSYSENERVPPAESVALVEVRPDPAAMGRLLAAEAEFWSCVERGREPWWRVWEGQPARLRNSVYCCQLRRRE